MAGDSIIYSASDLAAAARCEYALLRQFDAKLGWGPDVAVEDELLARTADLGDEHERRRLDQLREECGDAVVVIGRPAFTVAGITALSVETSTNAFNPSWPATVATTRVAIALLRIASTGLRSIRPTCL